LVAQLRVGSVLKIAARVLPYTVHTAERKDDQGGVGDLKEMLKEAHDPLQRALLQREVGATVGIVTVEPTRHT
jgi:hypothetical protein